MSDVLIALGLVVLLLPVTFGVLLLARRLLGSDRSWRRMRGGGTDLQGLALADGRTLIELEKLRLADRDKARQLYERLSLEKLDVLKTSIQSGYREEELARLDARLERIIGSDKLQRLLDEGTAAAAPSQSPASFQPLQDEVSSADLSPARSDSAAAPAHQSGHAN